MSGTSGIGNSSRQPCTHDFIQPSRYFVTAQLRDTIWNRNSVSLVKLHVASPTSPTDVENATSSCTGDALEVSSRKPWKLGRDGTKFRKWSGPKMLQWWIRKSEPVIFGPQFAKCSNLTYKITFIFPGFQVFFSAVYTLRNSSTCFPQIISTHHTVTLATR